MSGCMNMAHTQAYALDAATALLSLSLVQSCLVSFSLSLLSSLSVSSCQSSVKVSVFILILSYYRPYRDCCINIVIKLTSE